MDSYLTGGELLFCKGAGPDCARPAPNTNSEFRQDDLDPSGSVLHRGRAVVAVAVADAELRIADGAGAGIVTMRGGDGGDERGDVLPIRLRVGPVAAVVHWTFLE